MPKTAKFMANKKSKRRKRAEIKSNMHRPVGHNAITVPKYNVGTRVLYILWGLKRKGKR